MKFDVSIGERTREVSIVQKGGVLHVELDGRVHVVDARRVGDAALSLLVTPPGNGAVARSIDAAFASQAAAGDFDVHVDGRTIAVQVRPAGTAVPSSRSARHGAPGASHAGPQKVVAPMPGKIVRVLVKVGDTVAARQGLVVVEAMKMENELRAPREGRVRELPVAEGQSVDAGAVLVVVE